MTVNVEVSRLVTGYWKQLSTDLPLMTEREYGSPDLAKSHGGNTHAAGRALRFLRGLGLVSYRSEYGTGNNAGQHVFMRTNQSLDDGLKTIYKHFDSGRSYSWFESGNPGGKPALTGVGKGRNAAPPQREMTIGPVNGVVVADERSTEEVRAVAGPEPEKAMESLRDIRKDDAEALIEAARQYANRNDEVTKHVEALRGLGVEVDVEKVMAGISLTKDPVMEIVSILLPTIDRLQRTNDRLAATVTESRGQMTELRREVGVVTKERNDLQAANKRLSERNVKLQGAQVAAQA